MQRFGKWLFFFLIGFHLLYIWQQKYFLTADGPAHVYNAKVLLDILCGKNVSFYQQYYELNLRPSPNWFTHTLLMPLLLLFNPVTSEKILQSIYVFLFPAAFWFAAKQIAGKINLLGILVFPFVFHFLVCYGFYNYSFSIAFALLFIGSWKKFRDASLLKQMLILFPLSFLVLVTHIFGWFVAGTFLGSAFVIENIPTLIRFDFSKFWKNVYTRWLVPFIAGLIPVLFSVLYMKQNAAEMQYYPETAERLWEIFGSLKVLVLWGTDKEKFLIQVFVWLLVLLLLTQIFFRIKNRVTINMADAWLVSAVVFVVIYFNQPPFLFLGGYWTGRMSWLGWLFLAIWISSFKLPVYFERTAAGIAIVLLGLLIMERFPYQKKTSDALEDYLSAIASIPDCSTVLPLSFSHHGRDENGAYIDNYRWSFQHAFDYCGAFKPVINFSNYEATTIWFPLRWKQGCSPYEILGKGSGIEAQPPDANLAVTDQSSCNYKIDYVVTWCMAFSDSSTGQWQSVNNQLNESYSMIYESPTKRTQVWKRETH